MNPPDKRRAALYLAAVFVAGVLAGAAGGFAYGRRPVFRPPPSPDQMAEMIIERFTRELGLSPDQQTKLRPIARESSTAMEALHGETHRKMIALFDQTHRRIESFLTPEQVGRLHAFEERESRKFGPKSGPGPDTGKPPPPP